MAVQAIRYTLPESDEAFDAMLRNVLIDMLLVMLQDPDMEIRRLAMTTLNSATHNKPDLILPHLGELVPFVLSESIIKPELVREVMLGPFKHTVDDGLEVRKVRSGSYSGGLLLLIVNRARTRLSMPSWRRLLVELTTLTSTIA
jgi:cullin-associated NEDD8-dissociated protein 1